MNDGFCVLVTHSMTEGQRRLCKIVVSEELIINNCTTCYLNIYVHWEIVSNYLITIITLHL